jgi:glycerol-3-phosphate O-acyltransferase
MKNKQLLITIILLLSHAIFLSLQAIDPITLVAGPAIGAGVKECVDRARDYINGPQDKNKRTLNKHLNSKEFRSAIADGCNDNFIENCGELAKYLEAMEMYYVKSNKVQCIKQQVDLLQQNDTVYLKQELQILQEKQAEENNNPSYFQSLSPSERQELLKIQRTLVIEYAKPTDYKQEVTNLHEILNGNTINT